MASVRRKPGSRYWFGCFTDHTGTQRQRSTKLLDRRAALQTAETWEQAYRARQSDVQMRRVMSDIHAAIHGRPLNDIALGVYADQWLERVRPEIEPSTHTRYTGSLRTARELAPAIFAKRIDLVTPQDCVELRAAVLAGRSFATTKTNMKPVAQVFKTAWSDGLITENPMARMKPLRRERIEQAERKRAFTAEELGRLLAKADDEWRGMILAGFYTAGQRIGDIATLTPAAIDLAGRTVTFASRKTQRTVALPIAAPWLADLRRRMKGKAAGDPLFPRAAAKLAKGGGNAGKVSNSFRSLLWRAGLATPPGSTKGRVPGRRAMSPLSFHSFRHTATSMLKNAGVSDAVARDLVGHESRAVSERYTHIDEATKRAAMAKLPDITG